MGAAEQVQEQQVQKAETKPAPRFQAVPFEADESEQLGELAGALAKAQGQIQNAAKDSTNPHLKSKYADLAAVWDACRKALSANGLAVMQRVTNAERGIIITTMLVHSSGQFVRDRLFVPVVQQGNQPYTHALGSAITYGRRYGLSALVGVAAGDDDDGNAAGRDRQEQHERAESNGHGNGQTRTEQVKQQVASKLKVEDNATATPWEQIKAAALKAGWEKDKISGYTKSVLGRDIKNPNEITAADAKLVLDALAKPDVGQQPPPPSEPTGPQPGDKF